MTEPENRRQTQRDGIHGRVPASTRAPERQRFASHDALDDEDEGDLAFLAALVEDAESVEPAPDVQRPARRFTVPADQHLDLFRQNLVARSRPRVLEQMTIEDVEIDDLMEQLSTTAAALRRRKAA